jgi:HD-like signal output (HDOD) protein
MTNAKGRKIISDDMLTTCLDRSQARAGARLARAWGLSPEVAAAIEEAAQPTLQFSSQPSSQFSSQLSHNSSQPSSAKLTLSAVIRLANALSFKAGFHTRRDELDRSRQLIDDARRCAGFEEETCHRVLEGIKDAVSRRL